MNIKKITLSLMLGLPLLLGACEAEPTQTPDNSGAGDAIEDAGDDAGDAVNDAGDDAGDAVNDAGDAIEDAGDDAGDAVDDATN